MVPTSIAAASHHRRTPTGERHSSAGTVSGYSPGTIQAAGGILRSRRDPYSGIEVLGLGVVDDERVGRLFRYELELLGKGDPDAFWAQQPHDLGPVL